MWEAAIDRIRKNDKRAVSVSEIYDLWREQPFGVKDGLMPILAVAFILAQRQSLAAYREGVFRARFDDVDVEYLAKDAATIHLRWMDLSDVARRLLSGMAEIVRTLDSENALVHLEPIDVARGARRNIRTTAVVDEADDAVVRERRPLSRPLQARARP